MNYYVFEKGRKLLPAASKPYHEELLSSWIEMLAFNHGIKHVDFFSILLGKNSNYNINVDFLSYHDLRSLLSLTSCRFEEVISISLHFEGKYQLMTYHSFFIDKPIFEC